MDQEARVNYPGDGPQKLVRATRKAKTVEHVAKDLLRASGLPLLPGDSYEATSHVSGCSW
jgi:hypothetical protein